MNIRGFALFFLLLVQHEMILCHKMEFCANEPRVFCILLYAFHFSLSLPSMRTVRPTGSLDLPSHAQVCHLDLNVAAGNTKKYN